MPGQELGIHAWLKGGCQAGACRSGMDTWFCNGQVDVFMWYVSHMLCVYVCVAACGGLGGHPELSSSHTPSLLPTRSTRKQCLQPQPMAIFVWSWEM